MPASLLLRRHWRSLSAAELTQAVSIAEAGVDAFGRAVDRAGSLLQSWVDGREVVEFEHYPPDDVVDLRSGCQFYYHSHRQGDMEHGHLHLFWHASAAGRRRYFKAGQPRWRRSAPTHLFAISLDARGLPVGLFTVNRWVTDGYWFDAASTARMVDNFRVDSSEGDEPSRRWLTAFVRFYRPLIAELLARRDDRLSRALDPALALDNRRLEVLSTIRIDWMADLEALQRLAMRRASQLPRGAVPATAAVWRSTS